MKKFNLEVFKFASMDYRDMSPELLAFIKSDGTLTYEDKVKHLNEHLYDLQETIERLDAEDIQCHESIADELRDLHTAVYKKNASYLRITF